MMGGATPPGGGIRKHVPKLRHKVPPLSPMQNIRKKEKYYTARHDTLHTPHLDKISSDHKDRDMFVCILHTECK